MDRGKEDGAEAQLLHTDRGQHVPGLPRCRDVEPKHQAGRGLPLPQYRGSGAASRGEEPDRCRRYGKWLSLYDVTHIGIYLTECG